MSEFPRTILLQPHTDLGRECALLCLPIPSTVTPCDRRTDTVSHALLLLMVNWKRWFNASSIHFGNCEAKYLVQGLDGTAS